MIRDNFRFHKLEILKFVKSINPAKKDLQRFSIID